MLRKRLLIAGIAASLATLLIVFVFGYYMPKVRRGIEMNEEMLETVTSQVKEAKEYQQRYESHEKHEKELMVKEQYLRYKIPDKIVIGKVMAELQKNAQINNLEIISIIPGAEEQYDNYNSQPLMLVMRGDFFTLMQFARSLEECKIFMHVDSIGITSKGECVECRIGLRVYSTN